ncbi:hypothetical protein StoSoilB20_02410 [Arthrobacter sp. StoSoilB20]|nr:hypothetical protein StoSoilB20_02410 [Arthrobacter sp. StoSoilB20]
MSYESKARLKASRILAGLFCATIALSACTPATTENPMNGSNSSSDPATVKAEVEELKQALADLQAFKTATQQAIGSQQWADTDNPVNSACTTSDGQSGVNYSILSQTSDPVELEASVSVVRAFWESKGFTTRTETNPRDPGLIRLYANESGGHLLSYYANIKGSTLEMDTVCIAGNQHEIYKELDRQKASASPSPSTKES